MKQATQPGFYTRDDGVEVYVPSGAVRSNAHEDVARLQNAGWIDLPEEETAEKPKASGVAEADQAPRSLRRPR